MSMSYIPTTFHKFEQLPIEIRSEIWKIVAAEPRLVCIKGQKVTGETFEGYVSQVTDLNKKHNKKFEWEVQSFPPIPPLLLVCKELYSTFRKDYESVFSTRYSWKKTLFNFDHDTLVISRDNFGSEDFSRVLGRVSLLLDDIRWKDRVRVKKLAVHCSSMTVASMNVAIELDEGIQATVSPDFIRSCVGSFPKLDSLVLLVNRELPELEHEGDALAIMETVDLKASIEVYERYKEGSAEKHPPERTLLKGSEGNGTVQELWLTQLRNQIEHPRHHHFGNRHDQKTFPKDVSWRILLTKETKEAFLQLEREVQGLAAKRGVKASASDLSE